MKKFLIIVTGIIFLTSCKDENIDKSDPLSSGRGFIEASLKGDYVKAEKYILEDSTNNQYLDRYKEFTAGLSPSERENYRDADIIIDSTKTLNDSTEIIYYKNTYKKEPTKLKLIKHGEEWLVDFKYTFIDDSE
ncbi:MAG TPA: hypothetical protein PLM81_04915 [Ginsengibacter sp.]|nr:hypothetical protein [Ginsengibacter sp.]HRP17951.1 hypothetical protein [Ginsengibacter sp.]HRP44299.1 hypothetical protein [Ginsengibacter sp.]